MNPRLWLIALFAALVFAGAAQAQTHILGNPIPAQKSAATESSHVFKNGAGLLYSLAATTSGTAGYLMVDDATAVPSDGAVTPILCYGVAANSSIFIPLAWPVPFATGITTVFSTTGCTSQTKSATAFFSVQVR